MKLDPCPLSIELVVWADTASYSGNGWMSMEELKENGTPVPIESVGYLFNETNDYITLVGSIYPDTIGSDVTIPKGCIISRKVLKKAKQKR